MVPFPRVDFRYLAIEGPPGLGKTALAERLGARLDAAVVLDEGDNPFLGDFYAGPQRRGVPDAALLHARAAPPAAAAAAGRPVQPDDDLRLRVRARSHLRVHQPRRQRAVHLPAAVRSGRARPAGARPRGLPAGAGRHAEAPAARARAAPRPRTRRRCRARTTWRNSNEAYNHFFFHYTATPLLVVETSQVDLTWGDETVDDLLRQIRRMGTRHAVLRAAHRCVARLRLGPSVSLPTSTDQ